MSLEPPRPSEGRTTCVQVTHPLDEPPEPGGEAVGVDEMDEVAVARPLLELTIRQPLEPGAVTRTDWTTEDGEAGDVHGGDHRVDPRLKHRRIDPHQLVPV